MLVDGELKGNRKSIGLLGDDVAKLWVKRDNAKSKHCDVRLFCSPPVEGKSELTAIGDSSR
jgi:hypothetical protein